MQYVNLTVKEGHLGFGIFPTFPSDDQRRLELRARTVLAYGFINDYIEPEVITNEDGTRFVLLSIEKSELSAREIATFADNTGMIYISDDINAGWSEQPGRMFLHIDKSVDLDHALRSYFQSSIRWLDDKRSAKSILDKLFEK